MVNISVDTDPNSATDHMCDVPCDSNTVLHMSQHTQAVINTT